MSLLKNILSPFVEFPDEKKPAAAAMPQPPIKSSSPPNINTTADATAKQSLPETEYHIPVPSPAATATPGAMPSTTLPEHKAYFENLIEEANAKNPLFEGTDFKEFIDSKSDIDAISDEAIR